MEHVIQPLNIERLFSIFAKELKSKLQQNGFELAVQFSPTFGQGSMKGFDFGDGFSVIQIKAHLFKLLKVVFSEDDVHVLRYFFLTDGSMVHSISPSFRYRLAPHMSAIVSQQENRGTQELIFPAQKNLDLVVLQIDTNLYIPSVTRELLDIPEELANVFLNECQKEYFLYHSIFSLSISQTLNELSNIKSDGLVKRFYIESKALELLWMQTEHYKTEQIYGFDKFMLRKSDVTLIGKAKDYIRDYCQTDLVLKTVAREVGTNETKLKNGFKKLYGKTFGDILRNERLIKAKSLLEEGGLSIKEIAAQSGYANSSMFAKRFQEKYGILPSAYQKK